MFVVVVASSLSPTDFIQTEVQHGNEKNDNDMDALPKTETQNPSKTKMLDHGIMHVPSCKNNHKKCKHKCFCHHQRRITLTAEEPMRTYVGPMSD